MKIALTQMKTVWEDVSANETEVRRLVAQAVVAGAELIVFPEFTFVGFTKRPTDFCDRLSGTRQLTFMCNLSREYPIALACGRIVDAVPQPRNNLTIVQHGNVLLSYDKLHAYSFGGEQTVYSRGDRIVTTPFGDLTLGAFICYDLRFPEVFQVAARCAEAILVIGNWPHDRIENWYTLLRARALETQCYLVGVNRAGEGGGIVYGPSSVVYDPAGRRITPATSDELFYCEIEPHIVRHVRAQFPLRDDRREELYPSLLFRDPENGRVGERDCSVHA